MKVRQGQGLLIVTHEDQREECVEFLRPHVRDLVANYDWFAATDGTADALKKIGLKAIKMGHAGKGDRNIIKLIEEDQKSGKNLVVGLLFAVSPNFRNFKHYKAIKGLLETAIAHPIIVLPNIVSIKVGLPTLLYNPAVHSVTKKRLNRIFE